MSDEMPVSYYRLKNMANLMLTVNNNTSGTGGSMPTTSTSQRPVMDDPFRKTTDTAKVRTNTKYTGDLVCVDRNGTEHALAACDFMQPLMALRKRVPHNVGCLMMYAGRIVDNEMLSVVSLEPSAADGGDLTFHKLYFIEDVNAVLPVKTPEKAVREAPPPWWTAAPPLPPPPPPPVIVDTSHKDREIADLHERLRESDRRLRESQEQASRMMDRVRVLEEALARAHSLMDRALLEQPPTSTSPLRGSRRPNTATHPSYGGY